MYWLESTDFTDFTEKSNTAFYTSYKVRRAKYLFMVAESGHGRYDLFSFCHHEIKN